MIYNKQKMSYRWDSASFGRKFVSDIKINASIPIVPGIVSIDKSFTVTQPHDPEKDAYRNCSKCGKHINYHKDGKCS